jgi:hypothetical protein
MRRGNNYIRKFTIYTLHLQNQGQTARVEEMRNTYRILARTAVAVGKRSSQNLGLYRRIILKCEMLDLVGYNTV